MFDVKQAEKEAQEELAEDRSKEAKRLIKSKLKEIGAAKKVLVNLKREYAVLLEDIGETV